MDRQRIVSQLENLRKQYNELSSLLSTPDTQGMADHNRPGEQAKAAHNPVECEAEIRMLKTENHKSKKEIRFLKEILRRCNQQLNRFTETSYDSFAPAGDEDLKFGGRGEDAGISRRRVIKLHALLVAYDEVISEQESTIKRFASSLEDSLRKIKIIEEENARFREFFSIFKNEQCDANNPRMMEDVKLILEERDSLMNEIELLIEKEKQTKEGYEEKIKGLRAKLQQERDSSKTLQENLKKSHSAVEHLQKQMKILEEEQKNSVDQEYHAKSVAECLKNFEKLRKVYGNESSSLQADNVKIRKQKDSLEERLDQSSAKMQGLKKAVFGYSANLRRKHNQLNKLKEFISRLRASRRHFQQKLKSISHICSKLLVDRKELLQEMAILKKEYSKCSNLATSKSTELGKLTVKAKEEQLMLRQRVADAEGKRRAAEEAWKNALKDIARLRELLRSKDNCLQTVLSDMRSGLTHKL